MGTRWIAAYSYTGGELETVVKKLGKRPDFMFHIDSERKAQDFFMWLISPLVLAEDTLITLHGFKYIIPPPIVHKFPRILNIHPAPLLTHPELKGKDPQRRQWDSWPIYPWIGVTIHVVTNEIDSGEIIAETSLKRLHRPWCYTSFLDELRILSTHLWVRVLGEEIKC